MAADRIRKAAKRNPEGCLTFRVLPAQRVGIPKPKEASGAQHPTGRWKRPLGTADKVVKDSLSVPALSRSFSGYSYGLQRPWPDQRPFVIIRGRSPVVTAHAGILCGGTGASLLPTAMHFLAALRQNGLIPFVVLPAFGLAQNPGLVLVYLQATRS